MSAIKLGIVDNLTVYGGIPSDFADSWACLEDCHADFFDDADGVTDKASFERWARASVVDVAAARDAGGVMRCVAYIVREGARGACFHGYCDNDYRTPALSLPCAALAIKYFMTAHWLERLSVLGRWANRVGRMYAMRQGFTIEGRLRKFMHHRGQHVDAYYGSILREEV